MKKKLSLILGLGDFSSAQLDRVAQKHFEVSDGVTTFLPREAAVCEFFFS